ncbi:MAG: hypothetical protein ACPGWR_06485 [Ardenticatenaceae bacterium]
MDDVVSVKLGEPREKSGPLLSPLPYGGMSTAPLFKSHSNGASGSGQAGLGTALRPFDKLRAAQEKRVSSRVEEAGRLQGSPSYRVMAPSVHEQSEENIHMIHDVDNKINNDPEVRTQDLPDPLVPTKPAPPVVYVPPSIEQQQRIREVVTKEDLARLSKEVTTLYQQVEKEVTKSRTHATQALTWLNEARGIIMASPELFTLAELRVNQTRILLQQVKSSKNDAERYQTRLVSWNMFWLILFMALFALDSLISNILQTQGWVVPPAALTNPETLTPSLVWYFQPWLCVLVGGIGGALAALTTLGRAISRREYDSALNLDYYLNALKGVVLGGVVYYLLLGGFITAAATSTIGTEVAGLTQRVQVASSPLFILMAFLAGFAQQRLLALLPQVWGNVTGSKEQVEDSFTANRSPVEPVPVEVVPAPVGGGGGYRPALGEPSTAVPEPVERRQAFPKVQGQGTTSRHRTYNGDHPYTAPQPTIAPDGPYVPDPSLGPTGPYSDEPDPSVARNELGEDKPVVPFANAKR